MHKQSIRFDSKHTRSADCSINRSIHTYHNDASNAYSRLQDKLPTPSDTAGYVIAEFGTKKVHDCLLRCMRETMHITNVCPDMQRGE
jgi:hypothetical protein